MASAEYYGQAQQPAQQFQPPRPQQSTLAPQPNQSLPYPISDAPPPYSAFAEHPRPHSQPPPQHRVSQSAAPAQYNGYPPQNNQQYPPEKRGNINNMYQPGDFGGSYPQPQGQQQAPYPTQTQGYPPQQGPPHPQVSFQPTPAMASVYNNDPRNRPQSTPAGYQQQQQQQPPFHRRSSSRSRSRSHSRDRNRPHHKHHHHQRPAPAQRKKSSGVSTFLGAGGGAIIGDAIFPGLGTIGGAILGGVGGHEYGKQRRSYSATNQRPMRPRSYSNGDDYDDYRRGRKY